MYYLSKMRWIVYPIITLLVIIGLLKPNKTVNIQEVEVVHKFDHWLPQWMGTHVGAVTFGNTIYYRYKKELIPPWLVAHELRHVYQYNKYGTVLFTAMYVGSYLKNFVKFRNHLESYYYNTLEIDARSFEHDPVYQELGRKALK